MKQVSFSKKRAVRIFEMTPQEDRENVWWQAKDYSKFKKSNAAVTAMLLTGIDLENSSRYCARGLEFLSPEKFRERREAIECSIDAVLGEQHFLYKEHGSTDGFAPSLVEAYRKESVESLKRAHFRASRDEKAVSCIRESKPRRRGILRRLGAKAQRRILAKSKRER